MSCPVSTRYSRTVLLPEIGQEGQRRISAGSVLVVGAGALGGTAALYLAASGVGHIGIADFDTVDISNLQRQIAYAESDAGQSKVASLGKRLRALNSDIEITEYELFLSRCNIDEIILGFDFIVEGSDNPHTKMLVSQTCARLGRGYCMGGVSGFSGQVMTHSGESAHYHDIFPEPSENTGFTPCGADGVFGPLTGTIATIQASEALKYLSGAGRLLTDTLLTFDARDMSMSRFSL